MTAPVALLILTAFAVPFTVLGLLQARADAPTWDEGLYLASGVTVLTRHEIRINHEHPPLAKVLAALPVLLADPPVPDTQAWRDAKQFSYAADFVTAQREAGTLRTVTFLGRLVPLAQGVAVAFVLYALAQRLFDRRAGVLAGVLWLTTPFTLGLAHLNVTDVTFTLTTLLTCLALARHLTVRTTASAALVGLAAGAALLTRHTGLLLLAVVGLVVVVATWRAGWLAALGHGALVGLVAWACVWAGYRALAPDPGEPLTQPQLEVFTVDVPTDPPVTARLVNLLPWPAEYELGVDYLARVSAPPAPAFLLGQPWDGARWWYWPASMLVKLAATTLLALLGGLLAWRWLAPERRRQALLVLAPPAVALAAFTVTQPRPIGLRYLLSVLALWLVAAAPLARLWRPAWGRAALTALVAVQVVTLFASHPFSLAWTAPPFRPAYRYVADANLDWNQDYWRLVDWAEGRDPWVAIFASPGLGVDVIPGARQLLGVEPRAVTGWVAAFSSILTTYKRDDLAWLRAYCPVGDLGGSILLYYFEEPPDPAPGPAQPAAPCDGEVSRRVG